MQLVEVKRRKSLALDAADIPPAPLDPEHVLLRTIDRIDFSELRARIPTAKIRNPQIRSQQIRPIPQQLRRIELARDVFVPAIFQKAQFLGHSRSFSMAQV